MTFQTSRKTSFDDADRGLARSHWDSKFHGRASFGSLIDGTPISLYVLRNTHGMEAHIATYGGIVTSLTALDRHGHYADVVLGEWQAVKGQTRWLREQGRHRSRFWTSASQAQAFRHPDSF